MKPDNVLSARALMYALLVLRRCARGESRGNPAGKAISHDVGAFDAPDAACAVGACRACVPALSRKGDRGDQLEVPPQRGGTCEGRLALVDWLWLTSIKCILNFSSSPQHLT